MCSAQPSSFPDPNSPEAQQSPIHIRNPFLVELSDAYFQVGWHRSEPLKGQIVTDDHGIKVAFNPDDHHYIDLGGKRFHLASFHFHSRSEHWVEGRQYPVELHIVHQNVEDLTFAVVAVFLTSPKEEKKADSGLIAPSGGLHPTPELVSQMPKLLREEAEHHNSPSVATNPWEFLPGGRQPTEYFLYEGSLTTPPYSENVSWVVLKHPFWMEDHALDQLADEFEEPARFPWPLNRRFVLARSDAATPAGSSPRESVAKTSTARKRVKTRGNTGQKS